MGDKSRKKFRNFSSSSQLCSCVGYYYVVHLQTPFLKRESVSFILLGSLKTELQVHNYYRFGERETRMKNELPSWEIRGGGSTENNDIKVGPRERGYTRTIPLPSPAWLRCPDAFLVLSRFVAHCHKNENENENQLRHAAGDPRRHAAPRAI